MSFSVDIKKELTQNQLNENEAKAMLGAMIIHCGSLVIKNKEFHLKATFTVPFVARRYYELLSTCYQVKGELYEVKANSTSKKRNIDVLVTSKVKLILEDLGILSVSGLNDSISQYYLNQENCVRAYLSGWFLVSGSINSASSSNYHCELRVRKESIAHRLIGLFNYFDVAFKYGLRRQEQFIYVKSAEKIADVLRIIMANNALFDFEELRMKRDMKISMVRLDNCEIANEVKSIQASNTQVAAIEFLKEQHVFDYLDQKIQAIADIRLEFPNHSLKELALVYSNRTGIQLSKSGIKHRLDRLVKHAAEMKGRIK